MKAERESTSSTFVEIRYEYEYTTVTPTTPARDNRSSEHKHFVISSLSQDACGSPSSLLSPSFLSCVFFSPPFLHLKEMDKFPRSDSLECIPDGEKAFAFLRRLRWSLLDKEKEIENCAAGPDIRYPSFCRNMLVVLMLYFTYFHGHGMFLLMDIKVAR